VSFCAGVRRGCPFRGGDVLDGFAFLDANPVGALDALRRGWVIAQDNGIRCNESYLATNLARLEALHGAQVAALDYLTVTIDNYRDSGNTPGLTSPLAILAAFLHRVGRHESAATIAGFAYSPLTASTFPELNAAIAGLRDVLGEQAYESLVRKGKAMPLAAMATFACDQIASTRTESEATSSDS
jgi:hypothetical protein